MKAVLAFWTFCAALTAGAFSMLLLVDRRIGLPLPYSLPIACGLALALATLLLAIAERLRARRPVRIAAVQQSTPPPAAVPRRPRPAQGVILLDFSRVAPRHRAA